MKSIVDCDQFDVTDCIGYGVVCCDFDVLK